MNAQPRLLMATTALLALLALALPAVSSAGTQSGTISSLIVRDADGLTYFVLTGTASGKPPCATAPYWMIPNEDSPVGQRLFAQLLAAQAAGLTVNVTGKNSCVRWGDGEDVNSLQIG